MLLKYSAALFIKFQNEKTSMAISLHTLLMGDILMRGDPL